MNGSAFLVWGSGFVLLGAIGTILIMLGQNILSQQQAERLEHKNEEQAKQIMHLRSEAEVLRNIGKSQLMATFYTEELNHEIRTIYFRLRLKKPMPFQELCPFKLAFEFNPGIEAPLRFRQLTTDGGVKHVSAGREVLIESYRINNLSFDEHAQIKDSYVYSLTAGDVVTEILTPAVKTNEIKGLVKNFHDQSFTVCLPERLIEKIASIELIVNGWGLLSVDPATVYWKEAAGGLEWTSLVNPEEKLKRPFTNDGHDVTRLPLPLWTINVYQGIPPKYNGLSSQGNS